MKMYLVCLDEVFQSNNQVWDDRTHEVLSERKMHISQ